jgi:hypothetical protein
MAKSRRNRRSRSGRKSKRSSYGVKKVANTAEKGIGSIYGAMTSVFNLGEKGAKGVSKGVSKGFGKMNKTVRRKMR